MIAALLASVMNSRRFIRLAPNAKDRRLSIAGRDRTPQQKRPGLPPLWSPPERARLTGKVVE
jgi:hypothetical protein